MKHAIEINGLANLHLMVEQLNVESNGDYEYAIEEIREQLILLERYMLAQQAAKDNNTTPPFWHEVRENPILYPTNRERSGK